MSLSEACLCQLYPWDCRRLITSRGRIRQVYRPENQVTSPPCRKYYSQARVYTAFRLLIYTVDAAHQSGLEEASVTMTQFFVPETNNQYWLAGFALSTTENNTRTEQAQLVWANNKPHSTVEIKSKNKKPNLKIRQLFQTKAISGE